LSIGSFMWMMFCLYHKPRPMDKQGGACGCVPGPALMAGIYLTSTPLISRLVISPPVMSLSARVSPSATTSSPVLL